MKDDRYRVGVLHAPHGAASLTDIARAARSMFRPVILFRHAVALRYPEVVRVAERLFEIRIISDESVADACRALQLDGVTTYHDGELDYVDAAADELGMPGLPGVPHAWDKLVQRQVLAESGLTGVRALAVASITDLASATKAVGFPAVLKPRRGVSSADVALIDNYDDMEWQCQMRQQWHGLLLESKLRAGTHPGRPEKLADYVSVETVSTDTHHYVGFVDKLPLAITRRSGTGGGDWIRETGGQLPTCLPDDVQCVVRNYVSQVLTVLGIRWRITHTEVKLTPDGPELIEVNGRLAGHLADMLRINSGPDLVRAALAVAAGQEPEIGCPRMSGTVMVLKPTFPDRNGIVRSTVSAADLRILPCIAAVAEVAIAGQPRSATKGRMATMYLHAASLGELERAARNITDSINELFASDLEES